MSTFDELDLSYNREPLCPHCGHKMQDAWELELSNDGQSTLTDCHGCDREIEITINIDVTYTTAVAPTPEEQEAEKQRRAAHTLREFSRLQEQRRSGS